MNQVLKVEGMSCGHCERAVTEAIKRVDPKAQVKIDLASGRVEVESDVSREVIAGAVVEEGYAVA
jgi:copper chaperone